MTSLESKIKRLAMSISVGLALSILLSFGGYAQIIFVNGTVGDASSIYEAFTPNGYSISVGFWDWLLSFYFYWHFPLSVVICFIALKHYELRSIFFSISLGVFLELCIVDTCFLYFTDGDMTSLPINYLSNALGSPILSMFVCFILIFVFRLNEHLALNSVALNLIIPSVFSIIFLLFIFVLVKNLFWVTKSNFSAVLNSSMRAEYSILDASKSKFGIFQKENTEIENVYWSGMSSDLSLEVDHPKKKANVKLYLFDGCAHYPTEKLIKSLKSPNYFATETSNINLKLSDGYSYFSIFSKDENNGTWDLSDEANGLFSVGPSDEKGKSKIFIFSKDKFSFKHKDWMEEVVYRFDLELFDGKKYLFRKISIVNADKEFNYNVGVNESIELARKNQCVQLPTKEAPFVKTLYTTVLLKISYPPIKTFGEFNDGPKTKVKGLSGWFVVDKIDHNDLENFIQEGDVEKISIVGNFKELYVDAVRQEKRSEQWLYLDKGSISGTSEGEFIKLSGQAAIISVDGERISKTRWEKIENKLEWLVIIISGLIGFISKVFMDIWKRNEKIVIM